MIAPNAAASSMRRILLIVVFGLPAVASGADHRNLKKTVVAHGVPSGHKA